MKRTKQRKGRRQSAPRDMFSRGRRKGTEITITVDAELLQLVDGLRADVDEATGVETSRRQVIEGCLRKVWRRLFVEAAALDAGSNVSDQIETNSRGGSK